MCIVNSVISFMRNGVITLRSASHCGYGVQTEAMKQLRDEVLNGVASSSADDGRNLRKDRRNIEADVRRSFNKIILSNA